MRKYSTLLLVTLMGLFVLALTASQVLPRLQSAGSLLVHRHKKSGTATLLFR